MDKLQKDNEAAEAQLEELKAYAVAISKEIVDMVSVLEKSKAMDAEKRKGSSSSSSPPSSPSSTIRALPMQRRGTLLSMGKNRAGGASGDRLFPPWGSHSQSQLRRAREEGGVTGS